jgi:formylglycine-generating enzyme required for sulfatase activity
MLTLGLAKVLPLALVAGLAGLAVAAAPDRQATHSPETVAVAMRDGSRLAVARYEVSRAEWQACYDRGGCSFLPKSPGSEDAAYPVTGVNRFDVEEYISWINGRTGQSWRLPTAAEWHELAGHETRGAAKKLFTDPRLAWAAGYGTMERVPKRLRPRGGFGSAANGVADLAGNVWEWTSTCARNDAGIADAAHCPALLAGGLHEAAISVFVRDPASGGCALGTPPANIGFRLVADL